MLIILSEDPFLTLLRRYLRFLGHTENTIGNKYSEASCVKNTANNYHNIGARKSTSMSVAKKHVKIYSGLYRIPRAEQFSPEIITVVLPMRKIVL